MRRLLPDGLMGRFALLLTAALIAANLVALVLLAAERERLGDAAREEGEVARILALAPLLDGVGPEERARRERAVARHGARVEVGADPLAPRGAGGARERALAVRLANDLDVRVLRLAGGPGRGTLALSVALEAPPGWLNAVLRLGSRPRRDSGRAPLLLALGLSLVAVLGMGLVFLRQLTRPLAALADAARAAGGGDRSARVQEVGARELRQAAAAFNNMQTRIARFDAERTRTVVALGHDLRTPITSPRIRAEMLLEEDGAPMIATLGEMTVMADGLVAFARGAGAAEAPDAVNLAALLRRLCAERGAEVGALAPVSRAGRWRSAAPWATSSSTRCAMPAAPK